MTSKRTTRRTLLTAAGMIAAGSIPGVATAATAGAIPAAAGRIRLTLPAPTGPHAVGTMPLHLMTPAGRELMISLWYPARDTGRRPVAPWLPAGVAQRYKAAEGLPPEVEIPLTHGHVGATVDRRGGPLPVVLYSPGNDAFRSANTVVIEELASHGYLVVTIDHTGDAYVQFPDGRILTPFPDGPETQWIAAARVTDVLHVLDILGHLNCGVGPDLEQRQLPAGLAGAIHQRRIGIAGYSAGGVTLASAMYADARIAAGLSLTAPSPDRS